jgi:hypothetical protein
MSTKTYTETPDEQTNEQKEREEIHIFRPAGLKTQRSASYTIITKIPVFDRAVALYTMKNALLVISNMTSNKYFLGEDHQGTPLV